MTVREPNFVEHAPDMSVAFARVMQSTLVPPVAYRDARAEAYGRTVPHAAVGGDLVDLVTSASDVIAYVADVSGHGASAGVLMGMLKTAVRYGLMFGQHLPALLEGINRVLPSVKDPAMYATFAGLRLDEASEMEYIIAGNVPLLHYRQSRKDVVRRSMVQFPLGLFPAANYSSGRVNCQAGDLFAIFTDGLVETRDAREEEFGLQRMENVLCKFAGRPLVEIYDAALDAVRRHGEQADDRTLMLVRVLGPDSPQARAPAARVS
jgi:serine phosphatase RsbU (regulator of sigma subunit)